jgi:hypothetical protein
LAGKSPETIVFRLKRTKKASETYPLKLTQQQRETLLRCTRLGRNLKKKVKEASEGTQVVGVTWNELHTLNDATGEVLMYATGSDKVRLRAVQARVVKFFEEEHAEVFDFDARPPTKADFRCQFKITLLDIKPAIWRRIQVPDCTLAELHEYIQGAFGWENYHLHLFEIDGMKYGQPAPKEFDTDLDYEDEAQVVLSGLLPKSAKQVRWIYEYDFGDCWRHEVLFEGFPPADPKAKCPLCLEGERACPPEDVGGTTWGYEEYLEAMADPDHERHDEFIGWRGPFDPEAFDPKKATREMRKERVL